MNLGMRIVARALIALASGVGAACAEPQAGSVRLDDEATLNWTLGGDTPSPALGIALPSYASLSGMGIEGPIHIDLSTNYVSYIERWELILFRESDEYRRHPIRLWRGAAVSLDAGIEWDGSVAHGPPLRPGETVVALFRVRDVAGNVDESQPQTMLVSRYLMPVQERKLKRVTKARRASVAAGDPPAKQTIPVTGALFAVRIEGTASDAPMRIAGVAMDRDKRGGWDLSQILPSGTFSLKVQTERPIIGGSRLVSVGHVILTVPRGDDHFAMVKGTASIERRTLDLPADGLVPDGVISGRDAVRLSLRRPDDAASQYALAMANPKAPASLYRDSRGRSILRVRPAFRDVPWGTKTEPRKAGKPIKMRAQFPARGYGELFLPHTDIEEEKFFVSVRSSAKPPSYLRVGGHFEMEPTQGQVRLTEAGRLAIDALLVDAGDDAVIEVAYMTRASLAGLKTRRPDRDMTRLGDNGASQAAFFEGSLDARQQQATSEPAEQSGWVARNFGWFLGG